MSLGTRASKPFNSRLIKIWGLRAYGFTLNPGCLKDPNDRDICGRSWFLQGVLEGVPFRDALRGSFKGCFEGFLSGVTLKGFLLRGSVRGSKYQEPPGQGNLGVGGHTHLAWLCMVQGLGEFRIRL